MRHVFIFLILIISIFSFRSEIALAVVGWKCPGSTSVTQCFAEKNNCDAACAPTPCTQPTPACTPNAGGNPPPGNGWKCSNAAVTTCFATQATCGQGCASPNTCSQPTPSCTPEPGGVTPGGPGGVTPRGPTITLPNPLGSASDIPSIIERIVRFLRNLAIPIVAGMVIYGAFQIMTAGGDPEKFATGRKTILYAVIGYAIILIGWGIASIIKNILSGS